MNEPKKIVRKDGTRYYLNGKLHREDGPAVEYPDGTKSWYLNGKLHRTDGPAIEYANGTKCWWVDGKRHRTDGPALEHANGDKEWLVNDKEITTKTAKKFMNCYPELVDQFLAYEALNR